MNNVMAISFIHSCLSLKNMTFCGYLTSTHVCRYETTSAALTFTTYLLAKHPEVQQRLQQEIDSKFGQETRSSNL